MTVPCTNLGIIYHKGIREIKTPDLLETVTTKIKHFDNKINKLVYQLYGLSEKEVVIVEGK